MKREIGRLLLRLLASGVICALTVPGALTAEPSVCYNADNNCFYNGKRGCSQSNYEGKRNVTMNDIPCQKWSLQYPHSHRFGKAGLPENYCRNPDGEIGPWCYTINSTIRWQLCFDDCPESNFCYDARQGCHYNGDNLCMGMNYQGDRNMTKNNIACQKWHLKTPHSHRFWKIGLKENYCRNPDGEPGPWCYTVNPTKRWELCFRNCPSFPQGIYIMEIPEQSHYSNVIYNPLSQQSFNLPPLSNPQQIWFTYERFRDCLYAVGGSVYNGSMYTDTNTVRMLCSRRSKWIDIKSMNTMRYMPRTCSLPNKLLVCGGHEGGSNDSCEYLDINGNWISMQPMKKPRSQAGAVVVNGSCYFIGEYSNNFITLKVYHNNNDSWSIVNTSIPTVYMSDPLVAEIRGVIYICSIEQFMCYNYNSNEKKRNQSITSGYENSTRIYVSDEFAMMAAFDGKLYYMGLGRSGTEVFVYDPDNKTWSQAPSLKYPYLQFT